MKRNTKLTFRFFWKHVRNYKLIGSFMLLALFVGVAGNLLWVVIFREFFNVLIQDQAKDVIVAALFGTLFWLVLVEVIDWFGWRTAQFLNNYLSNPL